MKLRQCCLFLVAVLGGQLSFARSFDMEQERCQDYVIEQLVKAIKTNDRIALIRSWVPLEWVESKEEGTAEMSYGDTSLLGLLLGVASPVESLKGSISAHVRGYALFYPPDYNPNRRNLGLPPIHYRPSMYHDNHNNGICHLAFVRPQREPLKDRVEDVLPKLSRDVVRDKQFVSDARTLPSAAFLAKYKLGQVFATSVYDIAQGCLFLVDHPTCKTVDDEMKKQGWNILLSHQEVSEIVYLAYVHEDKKNGAAKYAEAVKQSQILQPMPTAEFQSLIGKRLHEALTDPKELEAAVAAMEANRKKYGK